MGHESQIELWSPKLTTFCFAGFGTNRFRCQEAMKTAGRENPKRWALVPSNRAHGAVGQNNSRSIKWAAKQEKFQPKEKCFFLTSTFIEPSSPHRDRGNCGGYEGRSARQGDSTRHVHPIRSSSRKLFHVSSADVTAGGNRPGPDGCCDTKDRSRGHNSEWYDHERQDRSLSDCLSAPIVRVAGGGICVPGVVAQRHRAVRCNCIFRVPANPRNWDSHRAGGSDGQRL